MKLNNIKDVDLVMISYINYNCADPSLSSCKREIIYNGTRRSSGHFRDDIHVSVALISRDFWYPDSRKPHDDFQFLLRDGLDNVTSNVLRDNPELYLT